jgi:predicted negative regulator of RcsB-dependent stress response
LIGIKDFPPVPANASRDFWEAMMATTDIAYLALVIGALVLFGGVLGWASWQETCQRMRKDN